MRKIILLGLILMLIPTAVLSQQFTLDVETAYTDPYPVEPGQNFILSLQVTNEGSEMVDTVFIELDPQHPFTVLENPRKSFTDIGGGSKKIVEYDVFVDSSAVSTVYEIPVKVIYGALATSTQRVQLRVQGTPRFEILDVKSNEINPGDRESLNIQVQNVGTGTAKRMTATFSSSSEYITPIFSGGSVYINEFKVGEKKWIQFDILADQDSEYGVYTGTISLNYNDESGSSHADSYNVGVLVSGEPRFSIVKSEVDKSDDELEIEVINSGTAKAIAVKSELWLNGDLFNTDYTTQVKIDKKAVLKFDLPERATSGKLKLYYKGPDNKEYVQEEDVAWSPVRNSRILLYVILIGATAVLIWKKPWKKLKWFKKKK
ncbi:MAG: hypothetical protein GF368_00450 [Candidatus Aenigmarchaeota archaeon]|nr:hypothetical protein [Candidatus Aenigmarchaeota archaeon]